MTSDRVWVVVPCFDEERRLDLDEFDRLGALVDTVLFVDDGSSDTTAAVIGRHAAESRGVRLERLTINVGKAEAVRHGLNTAIGEGADVVGYLDADLATPVDEFARLIVRLGEPDAPDCVIGARVHLLGHSIERSVGRHYLGRLYATAASIAVGVGVYDTQCGAKLFRVDDVFRSAIAEPFVDRWSFDAELISRILTPERRRSGGDRPVIVEVPLETWRDVSGSKLGVIASVRAALSLVGVARRRRMREREV